MLKSVIVNLDKRLDQPVKYYVLTVYPKEDKLLNNYENVEIISCKPEELVFVSFPFSILYKLFHFIPPIKEALLRNVILATLEESDLVIDIAGVSFVDGRGIIMTLYNYICSFVPLTVNAKLVKLSQATGPFNSFINRELAKHTFKKMKTVCPRGDITNQHLQDIDINGCKICADLAFLLHDDAEKSHEAMQYLELVNKPFISVSISSVVDGYCEKHKIEYRETMARFIDWLISEMNYSVVLIPQAARAGKDTTKNNDLPVSKFVYEKVRHKERCLLVDQELEPETLREIIAHSEILVASRFHAMISALYKATPVLLVGWSHKYQEVLDMFELGKFALDYKTMTLEQLKSAFLEIQGQKDSIKTLIMKHLPEVQNSCDKNFNLAVKLLKG